jgi:uncharacterized protein YukE
MQSGFAAEVPGIGAAGGSVCDLAQELSGVRAAWAGATDQPGEACGYRELTAAYMAMQDAWFAEIGVHIEVLEDLCAGLDTAARGYEIADTDAGNR